MTYYPEQKSENEMLKSLDVETVQAFILLFDFHFCHTGTDHDLKSTKVQPGERNCQRSAQFECFTYLDLVSLVDEAGPDPGTLTLHLPLLAAVEIVAVVAVTPGHGTLETCPDKSHCLWV